MPPNGESRPRLITFPVRAALRVHGRTIRSSGHGRDPSVRVRDRSARNGVPKLARDESESCPRYRSSPEYRTRSFVVRRVVASTEPLSDGL
jgi:hypothetical protein